MSHLYVWNTNSHLTILVFKVVDCGWSPFTYFIYTKCNKKVNLCEVCLIHLQTSPCGQLEVTHGGSGKHEGPQSIACPHWTLDASSSHKVIPCSVQLSLALQATHFYRYLKNTATKSMAILQTFDRNKKSQYFKTLAITDILLHDPDSRISLFWLASCHNVRWMASFNIQTWI